MAKQIKQAIVAAVVVFAIATGVGFIAGGFTTVGGTLGSILATSATAALGYATSAFIGTLAAGVIGKMTSKGIEASRDNFGTKVTTKSAVSPRQIIYGECRVGGIMTQINTTGTDNNKLSMFVVVAGHEVHSHTGVRMNDTDVTTSTATVSGETVYTVTSSEFTNTDNTNSHGSGRLIRYTFHDGTQNAHDGLARATLGSSFVPDTHKFKDCAYFYFEMIYDPEKLPNIPAISYKIKGKKVHDPRDEAAGDAWSDNPALIIRDYITNTTYGLKATSSEVNDTTSGGGFAAAANTCDQNVTLADNSTTEKRYRSNGFTNMSASGEGVLEALISSCAGSITYTNGKFNLFVGAAQTASLTITDDDLLEAITVTTNDRGGDLFNAVKAMYVDSTNSYQPADTPIDTNSTYLSNDTPTGESQANYRKQLETQLPFTTTHTMAQRLARAQLINQRFNTGLSVLVPLGFLRLQPKDWVNVTNTRLSYSAKKFEVVNVTMEATTQDETPIMACRLTLKETDASIYSYAYNAYTTPVSTGTNLATGDYTIAAPTSLAVASANTVEGVTNKASAVVTWTNNTSDAIQGTEIYYATDGSTFQSAGSVGRGTSRFLIPNVIVGNTITVKVRHFLFNGTYGNFTSTVAATIALGVSISAPTSLSATTGKALLITVSWTSPNQTNLRSVKLYRTTSNSAPTDDSTLVATYGGEPNKKMTAVFGKHDGLTAGTNYYFWAAAVDHQGNQSSYTSSATGNFVHVAAADIIADTITANEIAATTITSSELATNSIIAAKISAGSIDVAGKGITGTMGNVIGISGIDDKDMSDDSNVENINSTYWASVPHHYYNGSYLPLITNSGGTKCQVTWTTPTWASGTKNYVIRGSLSPVGTFSGDEENVTMLCVRATSSATGYQTTTNSDFTFIRGFAQSGNGALNPVIITADLTLSANTQYYAWLLHGISDYNTSGDRGVAYATIHVQGLGL